MHGKIVTKRVSKGNLNMTPQPHPPSHVSRLPIDPTPITPAPPALPSTTLPASLYALYPYPLADAEGAALLTLEDAGGISASKGIPHLFAQLSTILVKLLVNVGLNPLICPGVKNSLYPALASRTSSGVPEKKPLAASTRPGSDTSKPATNTAGSHSGLNCQ